MIFLLQNDEVTSIEKRAVRHFSMLHNDVKLFSKSLASIRNGISDIPFDAIPVGTVEFVSEVMFVREIAQPEHLSYPECLTQFLHRNVWEGKYGDSVGNLFVKPRHSIKAFTGALISDLDQNMTIASDFPVWFSEPVKFVSEWRYYVVCGRIVGKGRYDDGHDDAPEPAEKIVTDAVNSLSKEIDSPAGYALDFGVLENGKTALVEMNDGWALGYYRGTCSPSDYAKLLHSRWVQIAHPY